ncbi:chemoreceptor glutamine deamidase CheD [Paenibacillus sp. J31TS4]|uniref:chemotaxis protein CheD n=1 Tax=Paenibacillus sp. J31TS4 TaxID=2807195 RepID=UPI001B15F73E|nr:chemotaxis protein CheD [Paenibacillus sp. J31TS4]GIP36835.1 chemoreceptor glutamine deamidase CheD [Paenibacillus sp. J31TS4]
MTVSPLVKVGMADLNTAVGEGAIRTTGLGSCVGVTLYDPVIKVAGMAHVMLPSSSIAREGALNLAKFADTALPELLARMDCLGAQRTRLVAKMAGGAQMFQFGKQTETMRIGPRNIEACRGILGTYGIPIVAEDTGGNYGRTIELDCATGKLSVRSAQNGSRDL